jgi:hypothetical protein
VWSVTEKEALAVKWACEVMRPYVYGNKFTVITDHRALQWVYTNQSTNPRLQRWALQLAEYNFKIVHRPGSTNANADGPSRLPLPLGEGIREDVGTHPGEHVHLSMAAANRSSKEIFPNSLDGSGAEWKAKIVEKRRVQAGMDAANDAYDVEMALPSEEEIASAITQDRSFASVYTYMLHGTAPDGEADRYARDVEPYYCMDGGLLLALGGQKKARVKGPQHIVAKVVVPESLRQRVVMHHHVQPQSGHMSPKATYARFAHLFWWPGMWKDTVRHVRGCSTCQFADKRGQTQVGPMCRMNADSPWDLVGVDIVGPFKLTPRLNKYNYIY